MVRNKNTLNIAKHLKLSSRKCNMEKTRQSWFVPGTEFHASAHIQPNWPFWRRLSDFTWILSPLIDGGRRRFQSHRSSSVSCSKKWDRRRREKQRERGRERGVILYLCFPRNWRWRRSNFPGGNHSVPFWMGCLSEYHSGNKTCANLTKSSYLIWIIRTVMTFWCCVSYPG